MTAAQPAASARAEVKWSLLMEKVAADHQWAYGHIIVDEAQGPPLMAWRVLLRRCPPRSMMIVGDLDQRRGKNRPHTWVEALRPARRAYSGEYVLPASYRTPAILIAIAESVMARAGESVVHPVKAVRDVKDCYRVVRAEVKSEAGGPTETKGETYSGNKAHPGGEAEAKAEVQRQDETLRGNESLADHEPAIGRKSIHAHERLMSAVRRAVNFVLEHPDAESGEGSGRVAVIAGSQRASVWGADVTGSRGSNSRVSLLSAPASKGLEFDPVILVEPAELLEDGPRDLFVALTRATHDVTILRERELLAGVEGW